MGAHAAYIYVRGEFYSEARSGICQHGDRGGARGRADRPECLRLGRGTSTSYRPSRRRRLHLRRGDCAARKPRGQEGAAAPQAAVPAASAGSTAARRRSTTSKPWPWRRPSCAGAHRLVRRLRPREQHRHQDVLHFRPREPIPCNVEEEMGIPLKRAHREARRRRARRLGQSQGGHSGRLIGALILPKPRSATTVLMDFDSLRDATTRAWARRP